MTLSTMYLCRGLTLVITQASPITISDKNFRWIGSGSVAGIPVPVIIFIIAAVVGQFILSYTATGRYILAVGSNREAARLSGIKTRWNECKVYIISGIMVSIAGIVYVARLGAAQANAGQSYEMEAVAASVLGGTSVLGGEGRHHRYSSWCNCGCYHSQCHRTSGDLHLLPADDYWRSDSVSCYR